MKTLLDNRTNFTIELVGSGEKLSCIPSARKTLLPKKRKKIRHSFIHRCGEMHGSSDWGFRVLINGDEIEITIKSTDVSYCLRIAFDYAREEHLLLVQGVLEKNNCSFDRLLRLCFGFSPINKVLDKRPAFDIARVALPPKLRVNGDERPFVLANASIVVTTVDSQLEAPRVIDDVHSVRSLVLPFAVVDAPSLSGEEQELDHDSQISAPENGGRKSIIHHFSASVKQWRSYRLSSVQKLNGYHILFLMMIAALFSYWVGLSDVTLDQIHLIIYNRIKAVMYKLMMYVMTNVFYHLKDTEFCNA